ncbi:MAG: hypothetical protein NC227_10860 [Bacteroides sp.]|nr:hypothetical protein [Bacteroides sp.]MCM1434403.1 hypothetical protein [Clostridiales bacterium]
MFIIGSKESLYFKGFDNNGIAEFTLNRNNAKKYDAYQGQIDIDFEEIKEQCHLSDCRIMLYKTEIVIVLDKEG